MGFLLLLSMIAMQGATTAQKPTAQTKPAPVPTDRVDHALELIRQQKHELAYQELNVIVRDEPGNTRATAFLAAMELQTGRLADCQRHVDELVTKEPANPELRELKGQLLMARRDWKSAEGEWRWIISERPNSEQAHMQLAAVLLQQDRFGEALAEVTRSLEINPKRSDARSLRGNIQASLGKMDDAALDWNISLVTDPNDTVALAGLAVYLRTSDPNRALECAKRAFDLTGGKAMGPIRVLALVYRARNENDKARQVLEKALLAHPNDEMLTAELNGLRSPSAAAKAPAPPAAVKPGPATAPAKSGPIIVTTTLPPDPASASPSASNSAPAKSASPPPAKSAASALPPPMVPRPISAAPAGPFESGLKLHPLALGGLTLGASLADLLPFERGPRPPTEPMTVTLAPRNAVTQSAITTPAPPRLQELPPPELAWGKLPLSTISPAFVYAAAPIQKSPEKPASLGEAARRLRDKKKPQD